MTENTQKPECFEKQKNHATSQIFFFFLPLPPQKNIGPMIRIGREIQCLPYAGFFFDMTSKKQDSQIF